MGRETEKQILSKVQKTINEVEPKLWYKSDCCSKTRAELFAEIIYKKISDDGLNIDTIYRDRDYLVETHDGTTKNKESNRLEEHIALYMFRNRNSYTNIGEIVNYQVPLKRSGDDEKVGKIDLIAYYPSEKVLKLLELKRPYSNETLLRAVLEIHTYSKQIDSDKLKKEFKDKFGKRFDLKDDTELKIEPAVLLFKGSYAEKEYYNENSFTRKLMDKLEVGFYKLEFKYEVNDLCKNK